MGKTRIATLIVATALALLPAVPANAIYNDIDPARLPSFAAVQAEIEAEHWDAAIGILKQIIGADSRNADAFNLLGFALRHQGNTERALQAYQRALVLDPNHTGALEYQGELFVELGQLDRAKDNLVRIAGICGMDCEAYEDLAKAIAAR